MRTLLNAPSTCHSTSTSFILMTASLPVIHLTIDEALALHQADGSGWTATEALGYLAQRARTRGEHARAVALMDEAGSQ